LISMEWFVEIRPARETCAIHMKCYIEDWRNEL
jgi:hypothetical protein